MFIRPMTNPQGQTYYYLVENYREGSKVRQRILMSLGQSRDKRLEELISVVSRHLDVVSVTQLAKKIDIKKTFILGPLLI